MDAVWEDLHSSRAWGKYPSDQLVTTVMRHWRDPGERQRVRVLEMGCGAGANLSFFLAEGFQVHGVDGAPSAIRNAKARLEPLVKDGQSLVLETCTFDDVAFSDAFFELVVDYFAIYANPVETIRRSYAEARRMLAPGGKLYSRVWGTGCEGANSGEMLEPGTSRNPMYGPCKDMGVTHFFSYDELRALFSDWSDVTITRHLTEQMGAADAPIEEWVVWATK